MCNKHWQEILTRIYAEGATYGDQEEEDTKAGA
jgi:hypothetical protein